MTRVTGRARASGFSLIELIIVVAVMIILAGMAVPAFGTTLARMRIQTNASQMVQDLRLVRDSAIVYQQDLYIYICTSPASDRTVYYVELFQKDPTNVTPASRHYTPADAPVSGKFERKVALYGMRFGVPFRSGPVDILPAAPVGLKGYVVLAYCSGKGSNFRGQPVVVSDTSIPTYVTFSGPIGIAIIDAPNSRTWYVTISPAGQARSSAVSP